MKPLPAMIFFVGVVAGCATAQKETTSRFVGSYHSPQPCSNGSEYDLSLGADGSYRMVRTFPEGVGPTMAAGERAAFAESGRWALNGPTVTLVSDARKKLRLEPTIRDGMVILVETEMFGLRLEKQKTPDQPPEPTPGRGSS